VFRLEETRTISNYWVISYHSHLLQIRPQSRQYAPARRKMTVCEGQDGQISIYYREQLMAWEEIQQRPVTAKPVISHKTAHRRVTIPAIQHPWNQKSFQQMLPRKQRAAQKD
jgi:hypothetical protein